MIIPIIYPSAGEFWLNSDPYSLLGYSFNNRKLTNLPSGFPFRVTSKAAFEVTEILDLSRPLYVAAPHQDYKRYGSNCVIHSYPRPFPQKSFVRLQRGRYDLYIASPELCFMLAARSLDLIDLVKFGYDLCAMYYETPQSRIGQMQRTSFTFSSLLKEYAIYNHNLHGSAKALKALKYVRDYSNSPMETKLAMFSLLPSGCGLSHLEMNKTIDLTGEGKRLVGYSQIRCDLAFSNKVAVEYNSNAHHLDAARYTDDMNRQTALKLAGYKYIAITAGHISNYHSFINVMNALMAELGMPLLDENDPARTNLYFRLFGKSAVAGQRW